jgi:hypothetical protein
VQVRIPLGAVLIRYKRRIKNVGQRTEMRNKEKSFTEVRAEWKKY